ncbi:hypothetical protein HY990_05415 [Candidatus Micrarchaeota archaeon]|nr:hypothetical protein [Candidatus Micrarchaeota archaeon]
MSESESLETTSDLDAVSDSSSDSTSNTNKKSISSRGVPSDESIYLPRYDSPELRSFQDQSENMTRNLWNLEELMNFIFAKKYQPKYYEIACGFMKELYTKTHLGGDEIAAFVRSNGISKATFYNRVLPRLKRVGLIKVERETIVAIESKRKYRPMKISLSKTFGNYFMKIGDSWLALVDDARSREKQKEQQKL